jgi:hypothetical protein
MLAALVLVDAGVEVGKGLRSPISRKPPVTAASLEGTCDAKFNQLAETLSSSLGDVTPSWTI